MQRVSHRNTQEMKSIFISEFIYKTLSEGMLGVKIGNMILPEDTALPAIVFEKNQHSITYNKECSEHLIGISFIILANSYAKSLELADRVIELFQGNKGILEGVVVSYVKVKSTDEAFEDNTYLQRVDFEIKIFE